MNSKNVESAPNYIESSEEHHEERLLHERMARAIGGMAVALSFDRELTMAAGHNAALTVMRTRPGRISDHLRAEYLIIAGFNRAEASINVNHIMADYDLHEGMRQSIVSISDRAEAFLADLDERY